MLIVVISLLFARYQLDHITDRACAVEADFR